MIRLDKIGDLVCTLPVDQAPFLIQHQVDWLIQEGMQFVIQHAEPLRKYQVLNKNTKLKSFKKLIQILRDNKYDIAISFQCPWWVNFALWLRGIPVRVGSLSQWHSFLFLNKGLRQKRSASNQHEADYNFDLVKHALDVKEKLTTPVLKMTVDELPNFLNHWKLTKSEYIVVHPGMAGSALNWPQKKYIEFIQTNKSAAQIVITGTKADENWLTDIKKEFLNDPKVLILQNLISSTELLYLLKNAKYVVAPSTGVLHLAASLGTVVYGIFSPIQVHRPNRWGARGFNDVYHFLPPVKCPEIHHCIQQSCPHFNCMENVNVTTKNS